MFWAKPFVAKNINSLSKLLELLEPLSHYLALNSPQSHIILRILGTHKSGLLVRIINNLNASTLTCTSLESPIYYTLLGTDGVSDKHKLINSQDEVLT